MPRSVQTDLFGRVPEVIIDVHEMKVRGKTSIKLFAKELERKGIYYRVEKLPVGDVILPSGYAVERKTVKDFIHSLFGSREGRIRLIEQMKALKATYERPVLLLEGWLAVRPDPIERCIYVPISKKRIGERLWQWVDERINVHPSFLEKAIHEISELGVLVLKTFDAQHGARVLLSLLNESRSKGSEGKEVFAAVRSKPHLGSLADQQIFFLSGLPGISRARAEKLLRLYGSPLKALERLSRWDVDVPGIGEKTIERIKKLLETAFDVAQGEGPI